MYSNNIPESSNDLLDNLNKEASLMTFGRGKGGKGLGKGGKRHLVTNMTMKVNIKQQFWRILDCCQ